MDVLYIVMPAFNEEANIEKTVREWYAVLSEKSEDSRLVVADSGSTDKTHDILLAMKNSDYPKLDKLFVKLEDLKKSQVQLKEKSNYLHLIYDQVKEKEIEKRKENK